MLWGGYSLGIGFVLLALALLLWWRSGVLAEQSGLPNGRILYTDAGSAWITNDEALYDYLRESHRLAALTLPKKTLRALDLYQSV